MLYLFFGAKKGEDGDVLWAHKANHNVQQK